MTLKRWVIYLILVLVASASFRGTDIAKLAPVEVVWLSESAGEVYLETDTGDSGKGNSVAAAYSNMKASAHRSIFLETADYLILQNGDEHLIAETFDLLRPSCMICTAQRIPDMESVASFLSAHKPNLVLRQYLVQQEVLPMLEEKDGRFYWLE